MCSISAKKVDLWGGGEAVAGCFLVAQKLQALLLRHQLAHPRATVLFIHASSSLWPCARRICRYAAK